MKRIKQYFSYALYSIIAKRLPKSNARLIGGICKRIRSFFAKGFIAYCGKNVNIQKGAAFSTRLQIGDNSSLGINSAVEGKVIIGNNVMMGPEVLIYTQNHAHDRTDVPMIQQGYDKEMPVIIKDDVWLGSRVTILPGITIGTGSIVGASAVVTKDVPDYTIVAGNPAKVIKQRK